MSRSNPFSTGEVIAAPNWDIQVLEYTRGDNAWNAISAANRYNEAAPDGMEYISIKIKAKCTYSDSDTHDIRGYDFRLTGDGNIRYNPSSVVEPSPELDAELFAGGETEGWVSFLVQKEEQNLILIFDESSNYDDDRFRYIALTEGAAVYVPAELSGILPNDVGVSRSQPAKLGEVVITEDWEIFIEQVVEGDEAWAAIQQANMFNDPPEAGMKYILARIQVKNISTVDQYESIDGSDFRGTGSANILYSNPSIVDPSPELDVYLFPGGTYSGWLTVKVKEDESDLMLQFRPFSFFSTETIRFLALNDDTSIEIPNELAGISANDLGKELSGSSPKYGGHEHHLSMSATSAAERLPRCLGGSQTEIGTRN